MYICVCAAVSKDEIVSEIKNGSNTIEQLMLNVGVCSGCCTCEKDVKSLLQEELEKHVDQNLDTNPNTNS